MRINQNIMALNAYRNLSATNSSMAKSLEKLSSGFRINRAADDAAGLVISQGLRAQISGLRQATRNAQDGISVVQTAEGALNEVQSMLNRMRDLSVQSANTGTLDIDARNAAQAEISQLTAEIDRIAGSTTFGQMKLLDGSFGVSPSKVTSANITASALTTGIAISASTNTFGVNVAGSGTVQATIATGTYTDAKALASAMTTAVRNALVANGATTQAYAGSVSVNAIPGTAAGDYKLEINGSVAAGKTIAISAGTTNDGLTAISVTAATGSTAAGIGGSFQVGAYAGETISVSLGKVDSTGLGVATLDVVNSASAAITSIDAAIKGVSTTRGNIGAIQNRFESTIANLQVSTENLSASESRIRDTDMAMEMTNFTRNQILMQAGTAMLAQANQIPQTVLKLING